MGDEKKQLLALRGLESAAGYLQTKVASRIDTRYTPRLAFVLDQGVKKQLEVNRILRAVLPATSSAVATEEEGSSHDAAAVDDTDVANASATASDDQATAAADPTWPASESTSDQDG
jgi:ribosome-binding factor A